ncbi:MAG: anthranilate synthase component I [Zymomonas mobilis subsp. pomaceae]|uniref:anthranilate synthase component I n=1 Tax=Zymomonas mobilis TaxID=542 RepID=UPI0039EC731E
MISKTAVKENDGSASDELALNRLNQGQPALIWRKRIADTETPVSVMLRAHKPERGDFLLESVEGGATRGRYSFIGLAPDLVFRAFGNKAEINRNWLHDQDDFEPIPEDALTAMRQLVASCQMDVPADLPSAISCLVGYFSYETVGLVENLPRPEIDPLNVPDMLFVRPTLFLIFDQLTDALYLISPVWPETKGTAKRKISDALKSIDDMLVLLAKPVPNLEAVKVDALPEIKRVMTPEAYEAMVIRAKEYIKAGDIFQIVPAQRFTIDFPLPPMALYRALRRINPSPFLYFLDLPGFSLIGSSPEILVRVRENEVTIRPLAGTRPRGRNAAEDMANRDSLLKDPKERAEHLMLLDLGRNDVGRVSKAGSVKVTDSFSIEYYSHVMHMVSNVVGQLRPEKDALDALFAGFPAGTVSGAPKVRACEIIAELEPETRGPYSGGVGYFAPDGSMDSCIVLRTAILKDGLLHIKAGAGIVADSDPASEQRECEAKAGALIAAAREAFLQNELLMNKDSKI